MRLPLKLNAIEQEHLQELYDAAGVARDELPYSEAFQQLCQDFQDRAFKNAEPEQVFGALLKYVRSGPHQASTRTTELSDEQLKHLKLILSRHAKGAKILPYSDEFEAARREFNQLSGTEMNEQEFWNAAQLAQGSRRRPAAKRAKVAVAQVPDDDDEV